MDIWGIATDWSKKHWIAALVVSVIGALLMAAMLGRITNHFEWDFPYIVDLIIVLGFFYPSYYCLVRINALDDDENVE